VLTIHHLQIVTSVISENHVSDAMTRIWLVLRQFHVECQYHDLEVLPYVSMLLCKDLRCTADKTDVVLTTYAQRRDVHRSTCILNMRLKQDHMVQPTSKV
jgi:hypothetical protein